MHARLKISIKILVSVALLCLLAACAKPYHLNIGYHLPEEPHQLAGQNVRLVVEDQRDNKEIFSEKAIKEFNNWDGTYALALGGTPPPKPVQTYDLPALFHEALEKEAGSHAGRSR